MIRVTCNMQKAASVGCRHEAAWILCGIQAYLGNAVLREGIIYADMDI